ARTRAAGAVVDAAPAGDRGRPRDVVPGVVHEGGHVGEVAFGAARTGHGREIPVGEVAREIGGEVLGRGGEEKARIGLRLRRACGHTARRRPYQHARREALPELQSHTPGTARRSCAQRLLRLKGCRRSRRAEPIVGAGLLQRPGGGASDPARAAHLPAREALAGTRGAARSAAGRHFVSGSLCRVIHTAMSQALWIPMNRSNSDMAPTTYRLSSGRCHISTALAVRPPYADIGRIAFQIQSSRTGTYRLP